MALKTIEYRDVVDKAAWPPGPWKQEPDKKQWKDEATGLACLIVRGPSGSLCGYVGVERGHPAHGAGYDDVDVKVHGGLTFASGCAEHPTLERWEAWRQRAYARRAEAQRYPVGDAAHLLKERAVELEDFDAFCRWATASGICHIPGEGEPDDVWWLGFDCAHSGDFLPRHHRPDDIVRDWETYKDWTYVEAEVTDLARQLKDAA
jgi:hypothetical protein